MQIDYEIKENDIHGKGVYTKQDIKQGTIIYYQDKGDNQYVNNVEELKNLFEGKSQQYKQMFVRYSYGLNNQICLVNDDSKYMNHSEDQKNLRFQNKDQRNLIALRDIKDGEQLLEDYRSFQRLDWAENLYHQHDIKDFLENLDYENYKFEQQIQFLIANLQNSF